MNVTHKRLKKSQFRFIWTLSMLLFFMPASYIVSRTTTRAINILIICDSLLMCCIAISLGKGGYNIKKTSIAILALYFWCLLGSSFINSLNGNQIDYNSAIGSTATVIAFCLLCDIGFSCYPKITLQSFLMIGITACSINAITIFLYKNSGGLNPQAWQRFNEYGGIMSKNYYYLGEDNASYFWAWPVLVISWFYYYAYSHKIFMKAICWAYTLLLIMSYRYVWSVLSLIACTSVPFVLFLLLSKLKKTNKDTAIKDKVVFPFDIGWISGLVFNFMLSAGMIISYFVPIIQQYLNKDATLSRRTFIWERSFQYIGKSFFIGYGSEPTAVSYNKILINHTHNLGLETMYRGGIVGLILFCVMLIAVSRESKSTQNIVFNQYLRMMIILFIFFSSIYFAYYRYHYLIILILLSRIQDVFPNEYNLNP